MKYDVAIIGAGVVGALTARALTRYKLNVILLEKAADAATGASCANSGIVHGGFDPHPGTKKAVLNVKGTSMMKELTENLGVSFRQNGSLVVAFSEEEMQEARVLYDRGIANGVPELSLLDAEALHELEPNVSPDAVGALRCASAGIVCPYGLTIAAVGNAMDNGAAFKTDFCVDNIEQTDGGFIISSGDERIEATYIVNCAGVHADEIAAMIGDNRFTIVPRKGEYMLLDRAEGGLCNHTLFQMPTKDGKGILISPTADGNLLLGPTSVPTEEKTCKETSAEGLETVKAIAAKTMANIPYRQVITSFVGLRASLVGADDFVIEPSVASPHFILAMGIESPGLSAAPAIAEEIVRLLGEAGLPLETNPHFCGKRASYHAFAHMSEEEKNELIRRDPAYGHVICRCEGITEGEIREAIRRNPPARTMDGVKRRVRAGMGRCQGGFCTTYVAELIAEECKMNVLDVTKKGAGSPLLTGYTKGGLS